MKSESADSITYSQYEYTLKQASPKDAYKIWKIMDYSSRTMEQKENFICDDLEYVKDILTKSGFAVIACDIDGNIVGNLLVKYPRLTEENLGYDVFLVPQELERVVHMDSASVLPTHRGHGLESRMIAFAENMINTKKYRYSFATVSPQNFASLRSLEKNGYQVMVTKEKYGGVMRCVLMKKLSE